MNSFTKQLHIVWALIGLSVVTGCSSFRYTPTYSHAYPPIISRPGLAIRTGTDSRTPEEIQPGWARNAEKIVASALADEVKHARMFERVKLHAGSVNLKKYSDLVEFRVIRFECTNRPAFMETTGREVLEAAGGIRGLLIADSIPSKYISDVEIEFELLDPSANRSLLKKTYSATRTFSVNGYQGKGPKMQNTSAALEDVIAQFVSDLASKARP